MEKDSFWFPHDANAHDDKALARILRIHGYAGIGMYWTMIELLRDESNNGYELPLGSIEDIVFKHHFEQKVIEDFFEGDDSLLQKDKEHFWSDSLKRRMKKLDEKRQRLADAGRKGGRASRKPTKQTEKPLPIPNEKTDYIEAAKKFLDIFNAAFERSCRASSLIAPAIEKRLKDKNIKLWQVFCLPLLVRARDFGDRKGLDPHVLLRDGRSPRTGHDGKTHGGYDWLTETFMNADKIILNERLTFIAQNFGLTEDLKKTGCKMIEVEAECTE